MLSSLTHLLDDEATSKTMELVRDPAPVDISDSDDLEESKKYTNRGGRKRIVHQFPEILTRVKNYIHSFGFAAADGTHIISPTFRAQFKHTM